MAFTKVVGAGIHTQSNIDSHNINSTGIITATKFDGPFDDLVVGGGGLDISGIITSTGLDVNGNGDISGNLVVGGNLTANGDFTTLNTTLREVELLRVDANNDNVAAGIITQSGAGNILELYDGASQVVTVDDEGKVGIGTVTPESGQLQVIGSGYHQINISGNKTANANKTGGISFLNYEGSRTSVFQTFANNSANTIYYGSADSSARGVQNHIFYVNSSRTATSGHAEALRITSSGQLELRKNQDGVTGRPDNRIIFKDTDTSVAGNQPIGEISWYSSDAGMTNVNSYIRGINEHTNGNGALLFGVKKAGEDEIEAMRISSLGRVGIGTVNPEEVLHVFQTGTTPAEFKLGNSEGHLLIRSDNNLATYDAQQHLLRSRDGSDEYGRFDSDGRLLMGVTTSQQGDANFQVFRAATTSRITFGNINTSASGIAGIDFCPSNKVQGSRIECQAQEDFSTSANRTAELVFFTRHNGTSSEKVRIGSTGKVGISSTNPTSLLTVGARPNAARSSHPTALISPTSGNASLMLRGNSPTIDFDSTAGGIAQICTDNADLIVSAGTFEDTTLNSGELIRINSSGLVMIGNTAASSFNASINQLVVGNGVGNQGMVVYTGASHSGNIIFNDVADGTYQGGFVYKHGSGASDNSLRFYVNTDERLRITRGGNLKLPDNAKIELGGGQTDSGDLQIYHNGSHSYIDEVGTGNLYIRNGTKNSIWCQTGGQVNLYYNDAVRLFTSDAGTTIRGEIATAQDYPNFRPTLDFNFVAEKKLDPRITYSRTGPASFVNEFGKVVLVGDNAPRFDHTFPEYWYHGNVGDLNSKGESRGLLIEESRTNIYQNNHSLTTTNDHGSVTQTVDTTETTAPDGTFTATKITITGGDQWVRFDSNNGLNNSTINNSDTFSTSIYMKTVGTSNVNVALDFGDSGNATFSVGQEWKRYAISNVHNDYGSFRFVDFVLQGNIYIWGLQVEKGAFPTSYIPTNGSSATRGYEAVTLEGTDFSDVFGTQFNEFSLVADYDNTQTDDGTNYGLIDLWGEATGYDDRIEWFKDDASPYHIETRAFGQGNALFNNGELSASSKAKSQRFATSWSVPDYSNTSSRRFVVSMGGEAVDIIPDNSGTTVPQLTRMGIGCNPTRLDFSPGLLHFKRLMVYNKTLSDGQLQNLSAQ